MKNLRKLRTERGISQQALADKFSMAQQSIHKYEHGLAEPDIQTLKDLAQYFGVSIDYLVGLTDEANSASDEMNFSMSEVELVRKIRTFSPALRASLQMIIDNLFDSTENSSQK